ncbi:MULTISPECIES: antibiotic biosynthesis monooxygenase [Streptomyces]|uniref:Antibiotic biosynthesis monooxygenase n=1 Tax=Streptomyces lasiicapitis TaxID=1923961 RepID=A0ABQ2MDZ5_9ACTN|nr:MULTISPECIES: antibiotic biosynthesis monooxygenase [Streptomyces]QIB46487.1 antibiotic biosynthesis monooxygenase [Streptomyces aureoverticillatus]GGO50032.1 antibiotic biosynthesis monooxygenase [Streptomyces lasiicapitis]
MTQRATTHPDPTRADVGLAFFSTWDVGTPERQEATVDAIAKAWESRPWPHEGLLSYHVYAGEDGATLMHHSQWRDDDAYQAFFAQGRDARNADIDTAVPGIERLGLTRTSLYRSVTPGSGTGAVPEAFVTVDVEFEGPDADRQRSWVDTVLTAIGTGPVPGLLAAHFHLSTDGTRIVNYAEWETAEHHARALEGPGQGIGTVSEAWRRVREFPGTVEGGRVRRYRRAFGVVPE